MIEYSSKSIQQNFENITPCKQLVHNGEERGSFCHLKFCHLFTVKCRLNNNDAAEFEHPLSCERLSRIFVATKISWTINITIIYDYCEANFAEHFSGIKQF